MCELCHLPPSPLAVMSTEELENLTDQEIHDLIRVMRERPTYNQHWRSKGKYYGYPQCCINAFVRRPLEAQFTEDQLTYSKGGFLPCQKHLKMIKAGKITIEELLQNRECERPFPIDDSYMNYQPETNEDNQTTN